MWQHTLVIEIYIFRLPTFAFASNDFVFGESLWLLSPVSFYSDRKNKLIWGFATIQPFSLQRKLGQPDVTSCLCHCLFFHHAWIHVVGSSRDLASKRLETLEGHVLPWRKLILAARAFAETFFGHVSNLFLNLTFDILSLQLKPLWWMYMLTSVMVRYVQ